MRTTHMSCVIRSKTQYLINDLQSKLQKGSRKYMFDYLWSLLDDTNLHDDAGMKTYQWESVIHQAVFNTYLLLVVMVIVKNYIL